MNSSSASYFFQQDGYVRLTDFLDKESCNQFVSEFSKLVKEGKTSKDSQCPLSEAVHGSPMFDSLLEQLTPHFEEASGLQLFPTYSYARLYRPGEVLKVHTDRAACEISATITLGFEGTPWPIYMADKDTTGNSPKIIGEDGEYSVKNIQKCDLDIGDAVLYKGQEKVHWRDSFEGEWQLQVFLHYVDANGKHCDQKFDGRNHLAHHVVSSDSFEYWFLENAVPDYACEKLIQGYEKGDIVQAEIGAGEHANVNTEIRKTGVINLPTEKGIGATLAGIGLQANADLWNFDVTHCEQCDFLSYDKEGHYVSHIDTFLIKNSKNYRKLTSILILNNDFEGGKLYIQCGNEKIYPPQTPGTVIVFPSFLLHGVEPVTSGKRRSIVSWLVGPWFK